MRRPLLFGDLQRREDVEESIGLPDNLMDGDDPVERTVRTGITRGELGEVAV